MGVLPLGTVTFLFTDIEGSTRLLQRLRGAYGDLLAEHERILRAAIADAGGQVVDTQGDAVFAGFPRARAAVAAATAAQRALAEFPWPEGVEVRVRMGMHSGEPTVSGERYVGLGVHRAQRICSAGHGGQVLLSGATRELVEDDLPDDAHLLDLGEHRLKDLERPEHLYQLVVEGLPKKFPPPRTGAEGGATVALAETATRRSFGKRGAAAAVGVVVIAAVAIAAFLLVGGGSSKASEVEANAVGFISAQSGRVESQIPVEQGPTSAAFGDGALWVANSAAGTVSRIDLGARSVRQTIQVGNSPSGIAVGGGGVWVANHDDNTVSWINPQSNAVVRPIGVGSGPTAVAYGFDSVWVTNSNDRTVSRIDPTTGKVKQISTNVDGRGIAVGGGSVWVTDETTRRVVQVDPQRNRVVNTATVGAGPAGVAYGDGSVWVANSLDNTVSRINAKTLLGQGTIRVAGGPSAVAFGNGTVWVSAEFGNRVVHIDPARTAIAGSIPIANRPQGLATADGGVWVAVQASGAGHRGGRLVVLGDTLGPSIDPDLTGSINGVVALGPVYDGLTLFRRAGGSAGTQLVPDLAAAIPLPIDGGKQYTFRLRPGIRYSNGQPLQPADFRRAAERMLTVGNELSITNAGLQHIVGAARCVAHRPCDLSSGIAVGPSSVTFRLTAPDPRFLLQLTALVPVPRGTPARDTGRTPVPSTGPYRVESYAPKGALILLRNRYFRQWSDAGPDGYADEIIWRSLKNPDRAVRDVLRGKADLLTEAVAAGRVQQLHDQYPQQLHFIPQRATTYVFLNVHSRPFDDMRVRRALNYAIDRNRIVALHGGKLLVKPTCQIVPPTVPGYKPYCPYTVAPDAAGDWKAPDLAKARALIAASGTKGARIVVWSTAYFRAPSLYFVALLRKLGYRASLHYIADFGTYSDTLAKTPSAQAGFAGWFGMQLAIDILDTLGCHSGTATNQAHYCNPRIDAQVARLTRTEPLDPAGTAALAASIDRAYTDAAPWVPLDNPSFADLASRRLGNFQQSPYGGELLEQMWVH